MSPNGRATTRTRKIFQTVVIGTTPMTMLIIAEPYASTDDRSNCCMPPFSHMPKAAKADCPTIGTCARKRAGVLLELRCRANGSDIGIHDRMACGTIQALGGLAERSNRHRPR